MITADDLEFHTPPDADNDWAETYFFPVPIPRAGMYAHVYVVVRPVAGVMLNEVYIQDALSRERADLRYCQVHHYLPAPERFSDISSPNGLRVTATVPPREYRIDYVGKDGTEIHVDWLGTMEPFDIHDPAHSPHAGRDAAEQAERSSLGQAFKGHFDMSGRVVGTVTVDGVLHEVDAIERMDRSWGPRDEMGLRSMQSISATLGTDLAFHFITSLAFDRPEGVVSVFRHGYVLDRGESFGITALDVRTVRDGIVVAGMQLTATDVRGETFELAATANTGMPWPCYPGIRCWHSMMTWFHGDTTGYGVVMDSMTLADIRSRPDLRL